MFHASKLSVLVLMLCAIASPTQGQDPFDSALGSQGNPTTAAGGSLVIIQAPLGCTGITNSLGAEIEALPGEGPGGTKLFSVRVPNFVEGGSNELKLEFVGTDLTHTLTITPPDA